ncbi:MAG TPA: penicillin-binding protein [Rectinemataceae bacterium]
MCLARFFLCNIEADTGKEAVNKPSFRHIFLFSLLGLFAGLIFARYAQLAFSSARGAEQARGIEGDRGNILDRNGRVLAMDMPKYDVSIWKPDTDPEAFSEELPELARILGVDPAPLAAKYANGGQNYFYAARRAEMDSAKALAEAKSRGKFKGVQVEEVSGRFYPEGKLASHLIGFTGEGNRGLEGLEKKYDRELAPKPRKTSDGTGRLSDSGSLKPRGDTITLTIDADLQFSIEDIMDKAVKANGADSGFAIALDVRTGEILAYVASPGFDLNDYGSYTPERRSDPLSLFAYEPGSVFKVYSMASILDMGAISTSTVFDCDGAYRRTLPSGEKIVIKDLGVYGKQTLAGVLAHSSNAGVGYASDRVSETDLFERLSSFGFGLKTGAGPSGESPGSLQPPEKWSARSKPTISIGQEVLVTPLQMIAAAGAIANGGILLKPTAVALIQSADGEVLYRHERQEVRRVVSEQTARTILGAMESAASMEGTGWRAKVSDQRMAVKTGTAQMIDPKTRSYSATDYIASTLGIFPADDPRIAIYVALVKPRGASYLGGQIAAPVLREASEAALLCLDMDRGKTPTIRSAGEIRLEEPRAIELGSAMPDLTGYSKKELLPLLSRKDFEVTIEGDGYVVSQAPSPGSKIERGSSLKFTLR